MPDTRRHPAARWLLGFCLTILLLAGAQIGHAQDRAAIMLRNMDKDGDGRISREEWRRPPPQFDLFDADKDGFINAEELAARLENGPGPAGQAGGVTPDGAAPRGPQRHSGLYFIDAHGQLDAATNSDKLLNLMDRGGVYRSLVSAQKGRSWESVADMALAQPQRIVAAAVIKGGGYHGGGAVSSEFFERLQQQAAHPGIGAMAETLIVHDGLGGRAYHVKVDFDDSMVQAALQLAKNKGWPFLIHLEFPALSTGEQQAYLDKLSRFLTATAPQPVVLMHMGLLEEPLLRPLLATHINLHVLTSHATPQHNGQGSRSNAKPKISIFEGGRLKPEWRQLFLDYPRRFVFALDNVDRQFWENQPYLAQMTLWWAAMGALPEPVAHAIAHGNAERLWQLPAKTDGGMQPPAIALRERGPGGP